MAHGLHNHGPMCKRPGGRRKPRVMLRCVLELMDLLAGYCLILIAFISRFSFDIDTLFVDSSTERRFFNILRKMEYLYLNNLMSQEMQGFSKLNFKRVL